MVTLTLVLQAWLLASVLLAPWTPASNGSVLADYQKAATYRKEVVIAVTLPARSATVPSRKPSKDSMYGEHFEPTQRSASVLRSG